MDTRKPLPSLGASQAPEAPSEGEYVCFVCYCRNDNRTEGRLWASWLQQKLESYPIPVELRARGTHRKSPLGERIFPIFRDESDLAASPQLKAGIDSALRRSRCLIVLCSPHSAGSFYVDEEIKEFRRIGRTDRILAVIISGEPNVRSSGHPPKNECFPKAFRHRFDQGGNMTEEELPVSELPLAVDFRLHDGSEGWTGPDPHRKQLEAGGSMSEEAISQSVRAQEAKLELAVLKLIAGILDVDVVEVRNRDRNEQLRLAKQRAKVLWRWLAIVTMLLIAVGVTAYVAVNQKQLADRNAKTATTERDRAQSAEMRRTETLALAYHDQSVSLASDGKHVDAGLFASQAARLTPESPLSRRRVMAHLTMPQPTLPEWTYDSQLQNAEWNVDLKSGRGLFVSPFGGAVQVDLASGRAVTAPDLKGGVVSIGMDACLLPDGGYVQLKGGTIAVWSRWKTAQDAPSKRYDGPVGGSLLWIESAGRVVIYDTLDAAMSELVNPNAMEVGAPSWLDLKDGSQGDFDTPSEMGVVDQLLAVPGKPQVVGITDSGEAYLWDVLTGTLIRELKLESQPDVPLDDAPTCAAISPDGELLAVGGDEMMLLVYDLRDGRLIWRQQSAEEWTVSALDFDKHSCWLAAGFQYAGSSSSGGVYIYDVAGGKRISSYMETTDWVQSVAFDEDCRRLAVLCDEGEFFVFDVGTALALSQFKAGRKGHECHFLPGTQAVLCIVDGGAMRRFPLGKSLEGTLKVGFPFPVTHFALSQDGDNLAVVSTSGKCHQVFSMPELRPRHPPVPHDKSQPDAIHFAGEPPVVLLHHNSGSFSTWSLEGERLLQREAASSPPLQLTGEQEADWAKIFYAVEPERDRLVNVELKVDMLGQLSLMKKAFEDPDQVTMEQAMKLWSGEVRELRASDLTQVNSVKISGQGLAMPRCSRGGNRIFFIDTARGHPFALDRTGESWSSPYAMMPELRSDEAILAKQGVIPLNNEGTLVTLSSDPVIRIGKLVADRWEWTTLRQPNPLTGIAASLHGEKFATIEDLHRYASRVLVWDSRTLQPISPGMDHDETITALLFAQGDSVLIATGKKTQSLWDVASGKKIWSWAIPASDDEDVPVVFYNDSRVYLGAQDGTILIVPLPSATEKVPDWAHCILGAIAGSTMDDSGSLHPADANALLQKARQKSAPAPQPGLWSDLHAALWQPPKDSPVIVGLPDTAPKQQMAAAELAWSKGLRDLALAHLREALRHDPRLTVPNVLHPLALVAELIPPPSLSEKLPPAGERFVSSAGIPMRWCPAGSFLMGSTRADSQRHVQEAAHEVFLTQGFWLSETEITQAQWQEVMGESTLDMARRAMDDRKNPSKRRNVGLPEAKDIGAHASGFFDPQKPAIFVTWSDAVRFCNRLNDRDHENGRLASDLRYRLPTEAEWEYACRAGSRTITYAGDPSKPGTSPSAQELDRIAWFSGNSSQSYEGGGVDSTKWEERLFVGPWAGPHPVMKKDANAWGLHDMLGNVSEWCLDRFHQNFGPDEDQVYKVDPACAVNSTNGGRVHRGCAFDAPVSALSASARMDKGHEWCACWLGFRVVLQRFPGAEHSSSSARKRPFETLVFEAAQLK